MCPILVPTRAASCCVLLDPHVFHFYWEVFSFFCLQAVWTRFQTGNPEPQQPFRRKQPHQPPLLAASRLLPHPGASLPTPGRLSPLLLALTPPPPHTLPPFLGDFLPWGASGGIQTNDLRRQPSVKAADPTKPLSARPLGPGTGVAEAAAPRCPRQPFIRRT